MKKYNRIKTFVALLIIVTSTNVQGQINCSSTFLETNSNIPAKAIKAELLSNGDMIIVGYRNINGNATMVVDRYNTTSCSIIATYICPDYSNIVDSTMQLLIPFDNLIYLRFTGSNYNNVIQLDSNLVELRKLQYSPNGHPDLKIALDNDGNLLYIRRRVNNAFLFNLQVTKYSSNNFVNGIWWFGTIYNANLSFSTIAAFISDTLGNVYATGTLYNYKLNKPSLYIARMNDGGSFAWMHTYETGLPDNYQANLATDDDQNILFSYKNTNDSVYFLQTYKFDQAGNLLWKKKKNMGVLKDLASWITTDANGNVYAAAQTAGTDAHGTTLLIKYHKNGTMLWNKSIPNLQLQSLKVTQAGKILLAGDKYFTEKAFEASRPYFKMLDTDGNDLFQQHDMFYVNANAANTYYGTYNDVVYDENTEMVGMIGERDYNHYLLGTQNYYLLNTLNTKTPRIVAEKTNNYQFAAYPNPVEDYLYLAAEILNEPAVLKITDMKGLTVIEKQLTAETAKIDLSRLTTGIYNATIINSNSIKNIKIAKL